MPYLQEPEERELCLRTLNELAEAVEHAKILVQNDHLIDAEAPCNAHCLMKLAIQQGSVPFLVGNYGIVRIH